MSAHSSQDIEQQESQIPQKPFGTNSGDENQNNDADFRNENELLNSNNKIRENKLTTDDDNNISAESPEQLYEEFFSYFLTNNKDTLNIKECKNAMRCMGIVITEKEIQEWLKIDKKTGREKIGLIEFKDLCNSKFSSMSSHLDELEQAFRVFDQQNTGLVDAEILKHNMKIVKPKMTDEELEQILSEYGVDKDGQINYRSYLEGFNK